MFTNFLCRERVEFENRRISMAWICVTCSKHVLFYGPRSKNSIDVFMGQPRNQVSNMKIRELQPVLQFIVSLFYFFVLPAPDDKGKQSSEQGTLTDQLFYLFILSQLQICQTSSCCVHSVS
jgi:hypothetical protein